MHYIVGPTRFVAWNTSYSCPNLEYDHPNKEVSKCNITNVNYKINIENDDM